MSADVHIKKNLESQVQRRTNILARQSHWDQSLTNYETKLEEAQEILADLEQNVQVSIDPSCMVLEVKRNRRFSGMD